MFAPLLPRKQQLLQTVPVSEQTVTVPKWVEARLGDRTPGRGVAKVLALLATQSRELSFASTATAAGLAGVNVATVVRAAQLLGFSGWPALRAEVRSRYLSGLSASEVLSEHVTADEGPVWATVRRDLLNLQELAQLIDEEQLVRAAGLIASARVTLVLGSGSFAAPGLQLSHLAQTIGHDVRLQRAGGTALFNAVNLLGPSDCVVTFQLWRTPKDILGAIDVAAQNGCRVVLIGDQTPQHHADEVILMPSEGASMFPSLVGAITVVEALIACIVAVGGAAAARASDQSEQLWQRYELFPPST